MNAADHVRTGQQQHVVVAFHVVRVGGEALAAIIGLLQTVTLDHRPHGPVEDKYAPGEQFDEFGSAVGLGPGRQGHGETSK